MSFLVSIGLWIIKLASNDLVRAILARVIKDVTDVGKEALPYVQEAVKVAMSHGDWTNQQKVDYVKGVIIERFPFMGASLLNRLMEDVYGALGMGKDIPQLPKPEEAKA